MNKLALCAIFIPLVFTQANAKTEPDESVHELVMEYLYLSCEALQYSYNYMYKELMRITVSYQKCLNKQESDDTDPLRGLQCVYIKQHWQLRYDHINSVEKAWQLVCEGSDRKEKQYEIEF